MMLQRACRVRHSMFQLTVSRLSARGSRFRRQRGRLSSRHGRPARTCIRPSRARRRGADRLRRSLTRSMTWVRRPAAAPVVIQDSKRLKYNSGHEAKARRVACFLGKNRRRPQINPHAWQRFSARMRPTYPLRSFAEARLLCLRCLVTASSFSESACRNTLNWSATARRRNVIRIRPFNPASPRPERLEPVLVPFTGAQGVPGGA
jgi:hypothetical protein